ncbi:MAG TPA: hypothetical protein VFO16_17340 [Pseudonocardiaceae bacterium]|nr:hypothetical protein [Pseudonocardiaceae bacterium]
MTGPHIAVAQEVDRYAMDRMAATAAAKAKRLWPGVIGEVLADEIMTVLDLPSWLRGQTRTLRLAEAILDIPEVATMPSASPAGPSLRSA